MTATLARIAMAVAVRCLGGERCEWAAAMAAEFDAAEEDGRSLAFAFGCLVAAWRQLPAHADGRHTLAAYALALVLILPMAALLLATLLSGFPVSYLGPIAAREWAGSAVPTLNEGNVSAVPSLAMLLLALAALRLRVAWLLLDRDWSGAAEAARRIVAVTVALVILTGVAFASPGAALVQAAALAVELAILSTLARASEAAR